MDKESLKKFQDGLAEYLDSRDINIVDKVELLINLVTLTHPDSYSDNIEVLKKERIKRLELERKNDD